MTTRAASGRIRAVVALFMIVAVFAGVVLLVMGLVARAPVPAQRTTAAVAMLAAGLAGTIAIVDRARRESGRTRNWLIVMALAAFGLFSGQAVGYFLSLDQPVSQAPLVEALPFVLFAPLIIAGIWYLGWPERLEKQDRATILGDTAIGTLGLAVIWVLLVLPRFDFDASFVRVLIGLSVFIEFAAITAVLMTAAASRKRGRLPIVQLVLLQLATLVYIGADVLGSIAPGVLHESAVTVGLVGYVAAVGLTVAFALRGVDEPETAKQLWLRDTWSTVIPLSPVPIAALALVLALTLGLRASLASALAVASLLLIMIVTVVGLRFAAQRELRRARVVVAGNTFTHATDQAWFQALTHHSRDMVLVVDRHTRLVYASPSFGGMVGVAPSSLPGRGLSSLIPDLTEEAIRGMPRASVARGAPVDVSLIDHTGVERDVAFHVAPLVGLGFDGYVLTGQDVTDTRRLRQLLGESRRRDRLTGLLNHDGFTGAIDDALKWSAHGSLAVLVLDLIDYRSVNDARGRRVGDAVMRMVAQTMERVQGPILAVARLSNESFGVLLRSANPDLSIAGVAQELRAALSTIPMDAEPVRMRLAMGYATVDSELDRAGDILEHADLAAAESRGDLDLGLARYDAEMRDSLLRRWDQIAALEVALDRGEFVPHYQPIVRLRDGAVVAVEALARRRLEGGGLELPDDFIPLAESVGLVSRIDQVIRNRALHDLADMQNSFPALTMSINVAPMELLPGFAAQVNREIATAGLRPSSVTFEITESTVARSPEIALEIIGDIRGHGSLIALDDFGTGFSSLSGLRSMDVDILKIDQSFVIGLATSPRALSMMRAITDVGRGLGLITVAEGVRTIEQADLLRGMGCDRAQGFLHSEPLSKTQLVRWLGSEGGRVAKLDLPA